MTTLLQASNISLKHKKGHQWYIKDFDLQIRGGEIVTIYGAAGTGKSALADCLTGLKKPETGMVDRTENIAYAPQKPMFYQDLKVLENLEFIAAMNGFDVKRIPAVLEQTGLTGQESRRAERLPDVLKKMFQLACAICRDYDLLVMDEPTAGLDDEHIKAIHRIWDHLKAEDKGILIFTNREMEASMGDRRYRMEKYETVEDTVWSPVICFESGGVRK